MDIEEIGSKKSGPLEPAGSGLTTRLSRWIIVAPTVCLFSLVAGLSAICNEVWLLFAGALYLSAMTSLFYFVQGKLKIPWIFDEAHIGADALELLIWWEKRRPAFNVLMFVQSVGTNALSTFFVFSSQNGSGGPDLLGLIASMVIGLFVWNIWYCLGFVIDFVLRRLAKQSRSASLLKLGIASSATVLTFPAVMWGFIWLFEILSNISLVR
ncbi:hypothetical protein GC174_18075 [bacterium]|nr:hypothetical protein [bacterium]